MTPAELERYSRHIRLPELGLDGQQRLKNARVAVVGAGGLGCPVLQYLTAAGVGTIGVIDGDSVSTSNLQRQILFSSAHVGRNKAEVACEVLKVQNEWIEPVSHPCFLTKENAREILTSYDVVVDGSDNFDTRYLVNDACVSLNKPLIFGSIYQFEGQVSTLNYQGGPTYRCLYPEPSELEACHIVGVLGVLPGITGCIMATEVLKVLTGIGEPLRGTLLTFNALTFHFSSFTFELNPENLTVDSWNRSAAVSGQSVPEISVEEFLEWNHQSVSPFLLDVRESWEYEEDNLGGFLLPLNALPTRYTELPHDQEIVVYCQAGIRSQKAVQWLLENGCTRVYSLKGGIEAVRKSEQCFP